MFVAYNMLILLAQLLGVGLTSTRRAVVNLIWGPQKHTPNSSGHRRRPPRVSEGY